MKDRTRGTDPVDGKPVPVDDRIAAAPAEHLALLEGQRLFRAAGLLFLLALVFRYFDEISRVLLIAFIGAILAVAYNAAVSRLPMRRGLAVLTMVIATAMLFGGAGYFGVSALVAQAGALIDDFPAIIETTEDWVQGATGIEIELLGSRSRELLGSVFGLSDGAAVVAGAFGIVEIIELTLLVLVGAFYVVYEPNKQLLTPLMRAVPRERRASVHRMFQLLGERLSGWLWATVISMIGVGVLSLIAFYVIGTPYPLLLGVIMGITDIIPIVGPWIGGFVAVAVTLFVDPGKALWVALAVLVVQEIESNIIRPMAMSSSAKVHPFVTLLALLLFGSLFGLLGAILALPITLALTTIVQVLWVEDTLDAGDDTIEPVVRT
jgi:predicted PurR-regulated permease PerM